MKKLGKALDHALALLIRWLLMGLIRIAFRPRVWFVSDKAKKEALAQPQLVICNHVRGMDGAVVSTLFPGRMLHGMVARDFYDKRVLGWLLRHLGCFAVDRDHPSLDWLRQGRAILRGGQHVLMCPEGKCSFDKVMKPFKPGCVLLAASAGVQVLPIYHDGNYHYVFGRRFNCMVGEPVTIPAGLTTDEMEAEATRLYDTLCELRERLAVCTGQNLPK